MESQHFVPRLSTTVPIVVTSVPVGSVCRKVHLQLHGNVTKQSYSELRVELGFALVLPSNPTLTLNGRDAPLNREATRIGPFRALKVILSPDPPIYPW
jgi:hypothetical protein